MEIAEKVIKLANSKSKIIFENLPEDDPQRRCPDIAKAKKFLDWKPIIALDEGLKKTIEYFRNQT
jgi:UDP-glucuronate decarboxylase